CWRNETALFGQAKSVKKQNPGALSRRHAARRGAERLRQFQPFNVHKDSLFDGARKNSTPSKIVARYNAMVAETENDPSLRIEIEAR
ncbi:hypothetical protein QUW15_13740, partial [Desulfovibrio piger]|nr:hypothetical protein [Desulfovibrio piger]